MRNENGDHTPNVAGAVVTPSLLFLGGFILGAAVNFIIPIPIWHSIWILLFGIVLSALGVWLISWAIMTFKRHKTSPEPWRPSVELVQDGPYGFTRNPIYLSFALVYLGLSFSLNSTVALIILIPVLFVIDRRQILREEVYLEAKFGNGFDRYKARVRRWI